LLISLYYMSAKYSVFMIRMRGIVTPWMIMSTCRRAVQVSFPSTSETLLLALCIHESPMTRFHVGLTLNTVHRGFARVSSTLFIISRRCIYGGSPFLFCAAHLCGRGEDDKSARDGYDDVQACIRNKSEIVRPGRRNKKGRLR